MKLHYLGTAGYHPNEHRHTSCYFIPEVSLMFDAGTGLFRMGPLVQSECVDVLLSHAHLDHIVGLTFVLDLIATTQLKRLRVFGEEAKLEAIRVHLFSELIFPILPPIEFIPLQRVPSSKGGFELKVAGAVGCWFPLEHPGGSIGFRLDWPTHSLAYITDTTAKSDSDYWSIVRGVDVLLHECNFTDGWEDFASKTGHSCLTPVLHGASKADVKHLVLTHMNPLDIDNHLQSQARRILLETYLDPLQVYTASDGVIFDLLE